MNPTLHRSPFQRVMRVLGYLAMALIALALFAAALLFYLLYVPAPALPAFSGQHAALTMEHGGLQRKFLTYLPRGLPKGAPLLVVMHGSGESGEDVRVGTGYGFERLADQHGFAVVYPESKTFDWNDCSSVGEYRVKSVEVDDVGFLRALAGNLVATHGLDPRRVYATGVSAGGSMSIRLALEAPSTFRAVAAVAANVPQPRHFKCKPAAVAASTMLMNGTQDPLVPFAGGEVNLLGMFFKAGYVRSSRDSGHFMAAANGITIAPGITRTAADEVVIDRFHWGGGSAREVELIAIQGGGHGLPQPYARRPRLLGPSPMTPNGPEMIWQFLERQGR